MPNPAELLWGLKLDWVCELWENGLAFAVYVINEHVLIRIAITIDERKELQYNVIQFFFPFHNFCNFIHFNEGFKNLLHIFILFYF